MADRDTQTSVPMTSGDAASIAIHQLVHTAWPGDAVTQLALAVRDTLRSSVGSELFAYGIHPEMTREARPAHTLPASGRDGVLVYHLSIGQPEVTNLLLERDDQLVLVYHNITPDVELLETDPDLAMRSHWGLVELELLRDRVDLAVAYSTFSAAELETAGYDNVLVTPFGLDPRRLVTFPGAPSVMGDVPYLLTVSQLLPHKAVEDTLSAVHVLQSHLRREIGLVVVGHPRDVAYAESLAEFARHLDIRHLHWAGRVSDEELAGLYRGATALLSTSRHEGFGVPLLEAMALGVPVIARAAGAVAGTVDDAALLLPDSSGPQVLAEAVAELMDNSTLRRELVARGRRRASLFAPETTTADVLAALAGRMS